MSIRPLTLPPLSLELKQKVQARLDQKTKPIGSLGRLESLAVQVALVQDCENPNLGRPTLIVFAGDHGIASQGVSAYPQSVTGAMVRNFSLGGAAINILARELGWQLVLVDCGTLEGKPFDRVLDRRMGQGTASFHNGPAMNYEQYSAAIAQGRELAADLYEKGCRVLALGEMGIGNSSASAMIIHYLCDIPLADAISRGAGCTDEQLDKKLSILHNAAEFHGPLTDPEAVLRIFGGFEMVMAVGSMLAAAERRMLIVIDGLIMSSAALAAIKTVEGLKEFMIFAHRSSAKGHDVLLDQLGVEPLLDLGMRLGEGSGAALALPLLKCAIAILTDMATFESAGVACL